MITHISTSSIVGLDQITPHDRGCAGGKAYNCARLKQAGFPVPDGVIVLATATDADVAAVSDHPWFDTQPRPASYAVRSSGVDEDGEGESFAGIHETYLDVPREHLADAVRRCRASALSAQAREYRRAKNISTDDVKIGVLIQLMVDPIAAGVVFTVNPVTGASDEMVINSSWGLGEALVSGRVDPDEFVVARHDRSIRWSRIGAKGEDSSAAASLGPDRIRELSNISLAVEREYGTPQDVEWCWDGARFWVVQSRPVTTMAAAAADEPEWTRANLAEVMPDVTSYQALVAFEELLERAERKHLGTLAAPADALGPVVKAFHGRLYFNLTQLRRICTLGGTPPAMMLRSMGHADAIASSDEQAERAPVLEALRCLPSMLRIAWRHIRIEREIREHDARTKSVLARFTSRDPRRLSDREICVNLMEWLAETPDYVQPVLLLGGVLIHETPVTKACAKVGYSFEQLVYPQLAVGERSVSAQQAFDLVALADVARNETGVDECLMSSTPTLAELRDRLRGTTFLSSFERFLQTYGHRGLYEYDWSLPRYADDPTPLLLTLRAHLSAGASAEQPDEIHLRERRARDAWKGFEERLSTWQRWTMLPSVRRSVRQIKKYYVWREQVRFDLVKCLAVVRGWLLVLADRFVERGWLAAKSDYFQLTFDELAAAVNGQLSPERLRAMVAERSREMERNRALRLPLLMRASTLPALIRTADMNGGSLSDDDGLVGLPVSSGCVEAEVVIVRSPDDFSRMKRGAILVAPATDPSWTPLFTLASGVIVEIGGVLSHASTIAREYGLPALANVKHATRRLRNGERIRLDAQRGIVERLENI